MKSTLKCEIRYENERKNSTLSLKGPYKRQYFLSIKKLKVFLIHPV